MRSQTASNKPNYSPDTQKKTQITAIFRYNVILIFRELNFFEAYCTVFLQNNF
jgi:hypothetical protein